MRVVPVAHPRDPGPLVRRGLTGEGQRAVEVGTPVDPARLGGRVIRHEREPVEVADEVLAAGAARHVPGVVVDLQHPARRGAAPLTIEHRQLEQGRTLPDPDRRSGRSEARALVPRHEVGRTEHDHLATIGQRDDHDPAFGRCVPEHVRVAEVDEVEVDHRIGTERLERGAPVPADGDPLILTDPERVVVVSVPGVERGDGPVGQRRSAAREDHVIVCDRDRHGQLLPGHQVVGHGVTPRDVAPLEPVRVVLEEEMPTIAVDDRTVRVVDPVTPRREVHERAVGIAGVVRDGIHHRRTNLLRPP